MPRFRLAFAALIAALMLGNAVAVANDAVHRHAVAAPVLPAVDAATEIIGGTLHSMRVIDRRTSASVDYFWLREADGTRVPLKWLSAEHAQAGAVIRVEGRRGNEAFFVESVATLQKGGAAADKLPPDARRFAGTLEFLYADDLDADRWVLVYSLRGDDGSHVPVQFPVAPEILESGMSIVVDGVTSPDGLTVDAHAVEILSGDPHAADVDMPAIAGTTQVLVILIKYLDTATEPFTQAAVQNTVFTGTSSVANYFREASYGKHLLAGAVTPWLKARFARPTSCNYSLMATEATYLAKQAGFDTTKYQKFVYVFPSLPGCGWAGLGGGSQAWINQAASTMVIGHELGHTFGLGHSSSLDCGTSIIGGTCSRSEYGDPYAIMGNSRAAHLSAPHKATLGYFATSQVQTHAGGTVTYTLGALETPGAQTYAVKVPASSKRTYWLEWRQPIGFDASLLAGGTNGALVHIAGSNDFGCSTCLLDMTPATTPFTDASLPVGQTFTDAQTGASVSVLGKTASALTVQISTPKAPTFADVPVTHVAYAAVEALKWSSVTNGCASSPLRFCPNNLVTRAEMAVFIERAKRGADSRFTATGTRFADVPSTHWAAGFIEQFYTDGITTGCASNPLRYCPDQYVSRAQMAPFLMKAKFTGSFNPGAATGTLFADVPKSHPMAAWIERLYQYGITTGCAANPLRYCPDAYVTRAQMALFLQRALNLPVPPI